MIYSLIKDGKTVLLSNHGHSICVKDFLRLNRYDLSFSQREAIDSLVIDGGLIKRLQLIQDAYPDGIIGLTDHGGYRGSYTINGKKIDLNKMVGGAKGSQHRLGKGADFWVLINGGGYVDTAELAVKMENLLWKNHLTGGVGIYAPHHVHIHVDSRSSLAAWFQSYSGIPAQGGRPTTFKRGHEAAGIKLLQRFLNKEGQRYSCGVADGKFGNMTVRGLSRWQEDHGLKADGIFGRQTNAVMRLFDWVR